MANIHWFPGHMKKAINELSEKIKYVDIVIELVDARAPLSSLNPDFEEIIKNKKRLLILNKVDLADPNITPSLVNKLKESYDDVLTSNINDKNIVNMIAKSIKELGKEKHLKEISKGMKPQPLKTVIIGVPNVGKSTLINKIARKSVLGVANKPGLTRKEVWVKVNNDFLLLDTPGILPMNYSNKTHAIHLALVGSIKEEILPTSELAEYAVTFLQKYYTEQLLARFNVNKDMSYIDAISCIARNRCLKRNNDELDISRAELTLLKEIKDAKICRISFDRI